MARIEIADLAKGYFFSAFLLSVFGLSSFLEEVSFDEPSLSLEEVSDLEVPSDLESDLEAESPLELEDVDVEDFFA